MKRSVDTPFDKSASLSFDQIAAVREQSEQAQPWTEKYRPATLDGVVGQRGSVDTLRGMMLGEESTFPHLILCGPAGTGKTSSILAVARELYGKHCVAVSGNQSSLSDMVLEINASDERGIDVVRKRISSFVSANGSIMRSMGITVSSGSGSGRGRGRGTQQQQEKQQDQVQKRRFLPKLIIMDEADHLTKNAQNALRSLMEKHAHQVRFCFIVNYEHRMHEAICSRCLRLRFAPLYTDDVQLLLDRVCGAEQVMLGNGAINAIIDVTSGDMRQALNTLQSCAMHVRSSADGSALQAVTVYRITGKPPPDATVALLRSCFEHSDDLKDNTARLRAYLEHFGVSLKATIDAMCAIILRDPDAFKTLGFVHEAAVAHFICGLERAQRRVVLVTDAGRMRLHVAGLASLFYRIKHEL